MVFFDTQEHRIPDPGIQLAKIPKLGSQWRVIHDFKPTEYFPSSALSLLVRLDKPIGGWWSLGIRFCLSDITLRCLISGEDNQNQNRTLAKSTQLPKIGEWTKIEISHEEENGKFFLSLSVGGMEVGREEVTDPDLRKPTEVKIRIGTKIGATNGGSQPGFIRNLVVLEK